MVPRPDDWRREAPALYEALNAELAAGTAPRARPFQLTPLHEEVYAASRTSSVGVIVTRTSQYKDFAIVRRCLDRQKAAFAGADNVKGDAHAMRERCGVVAGSLLSHKAGSSLQPADVSVLPTAETKAGSRNDLIKSRRNLGFVVISRVVLVPPSRSISVFVRVSAVPAIPSRWTSFSMTVLPFLSASLWIVVSALPSGLGVTVVVVVVPGTGTGGGRGAGTTTVPGGGGGAGA